jgi:ribonucleoside-diphosphate reductase beta chain
MNAGMMDGHLNFIANRRLSQIGVKEEYPDTSNPFPWMQNHGIEEREKFFETWVIEYQMGGALSWH